MLETQHAAGIGEASCCQAARLSDDHMPAKLPSMLEPMPWMNSSARPATSRTRPDRSGSAAPLRHRSREAGLRHTALLERADRTQVIGLGRLGLGGFRCGLPRRHPGSRYSPSPCSWKAAQAGEPGKRRRVSRRAMRAASATVPARRQDLVEAAKEYRGDLVRHMPVVHQNR